MKDNKWLIYNVDWGLRETSSILVWSKILMFDVLPVISGDHPDHYLVKFLTSWSLFMSFSSTHSTWTLSTYINCLFYITLPHPLSPSPHLYYLPCMEQIHTELTHWHYAHSLQWTCCECGTSAALQRGSTPTKCPCCGHIRCGSCGLRQ